MEIQRRFFFLENKHPREVSEKEYAQNRPEDGFMTLEYMYLKPGEMGEDFIRLDFTNIFTDQPYEGKTFSVTYLGDSEIGENDFMILQQEYFATYDEAKSVYNKWASQGREAFQVAVY